MGLTSRTRITFATMMALSLSALVAGPGIAQPSMTSPVTVDDDGSSYAGYVTVPLNKSRILRVASPVKQLMVGNSAIADVMALTSGLLRPAIIQPMVSRNRRRARCSISGSAKGSPENNDVTTSVNTSMQCMRNLFYNTGPTKTGTLTKITYHFGKALAGEFFNLRRSRRFAARAGCAINTVRYSSGTPHLAKEFIVWAAA